MQSSMTTPDPDPSGTLVVEDSRRFDLLRPLGRLGHRVWRIVLTVRGLVAFTLITLGVMWTKAGRSNAVIRPLIRREIAASGAHLLPATLFLALVLGLILIGQGLSLLTLVGQTDFLGLLMVTAVFRELGPLLAALLVLLRVGAANVFDLGLARATGEVEALESVGIDPIHYLVVPRVIGLAWGVFTLTVYLILGALASGYLWAFIDDIPLNPGMYVDQLMRALTLADFFLVGLKSVIFGCIIAVVTCYHGLAQPLRLEETSRATIRAVAQAILLCVGIDAVFIAVPLLLD